MPKKIVQAHCKLALDIGEVQERAILRHCIMAHKQGKVDDIIFDNLIKKKIMHQFIWAKRGDAIENIMTQKFGILFFTFQTESEMKKTEENIHDLVRVRIL
ncbi:MAG: hypothetical protein LRY68_07655 [Sulfurospirillum sp.]|nr:hypothetical protein [Sulfurospirillum sp.]